MRTATAILLTLALTSQTAQAQFSIFYEGDTASSPATWTRPALEPGPDCMLSTEGVDVPYEAQGFITHAYEEDFDGTQNPWTPHVIRSAQTFDGVILLYRDGFDPADPCANLVAQNDNDPGNPDGSALGLELEENVEYYLVTTGSSTAEAGTYTNYIESGIWYADLELIGQPDYTDLTVGQADWEDYWYVFPTSLEDCQNVYEGDPVLGELPELVHAYAFRVDLDGYYDIGHVAEGDFNEPIEYSNPQLYIYGEKYNRVNPCENLYAKDNVDALDGRIYLYTEYALADDVWLEAGRTYVAVGRVLDDLELADLVVYGDTDTRGWGPAGSVLTDVDGLPPLELELDVVEGPGVVTPGSAAVVRVQVTNNTSRVQQVDAWVELRATNFDGKPYEFKGTTPPDPVRIPKHFNGTVNYAMNVPKGLSPEDIYLATFVLGNYGSEALTGDVLEFEVSENEGAAAAGGEGWQLRRLDALAEGTEAASDTPGAYPNPFTPATTIRFTLDAAAPVTLAVYDVTGREVARLLDGAALEAGPHAARFDAGGLASGVYVYRLDTGAVVTTGRVTLLK